MMAARRDKKCMCGHCMICTGIGLLIAAAMFYLGYGWVEVLGVLGVLAILKGLYVKMKK